MRILWTLMTIGLFASVEAGTVWKAGMGRERITPPLPFWLSGYAARTNPAAGATSELWAKALALEDPRGRRWVLVTTDLIGLPRQVSEPVAEQARRKHRLPRAALVLNSSHTHAGPAIWPNLRVMFGLDAAESRRVEAYAQGLIESLSRVIDQALADLKPARLDVGRGKADFAINRRQPTPQGVRLGENPSGPVDHTVPVWRVADAEGRVRAVLFGYACHNTTLGGDYYQVDGDYAGRAQRAVEAAYPGATALFLMLCGGDQNPRPRGTLALAREHGESLARAVYAALEGPLDPVEPSIRTAWREVQLPFASHTREQFLKELADPSVFRQRRARLMVEAYDAGRPVRELTYPVQAARLGEGVTLLALGGEVVVDYGLRVGREYADPHLVTAGYCNDVACYIPSLRVLREGGYEPVDSMIYYGQPGPFSEGVEEAVFHGIHDVMRKIGSPRR